MSQEIITYLAAPYSTPNRETKLARVKLINQYAAKLMRSGKIIFSPISHSHPIHEEGGLEGDWAFWARQDLAILAACKEMIVLCLPGWRESVGVTAEIEFAVEHGIKVQFIDDAIL